MGMQASTRSKRGLGPFSSRQLTLIACVAVVSLVAVPTAAFAASGLFSSATAAPAVTATNTATAANAVGVLGRSSGAGTAARTGVVGSATGTNGIGVQGNGAKYGLYSNGPLGVAAGKHLACTACVTPENVSNRLVVTYNLAAGANSAPITIPSNRPVQVMGSELTSGVRGVGSATILHIPNLFFDWTGLESFGLVPSAITSNYSGVSGTHILYIDYQELVDLQVNDTNTLRIHNGTSEARTGIVVFTW
jgi:hypothetical protein